jgi:hypothetical protein
MKPRLLRTCTGRNARTTRALEQPLWRPVSLCWPRAARRPAPPLHRATGIAVNHHAHSTLNLHLHLTAPQLGAAASARAQMLLAIAETPVHRIGVSASSPRRLMLHRELTSDARPARQVNSVTIRRDLASVKTTPIATQPAPPSRMFATPVTRDAASATCLTPVAPSVARARSVRKALLTMARAPRTRAQQVNVANRTAAPPAPHRQALIWQRPATPAAPRTEAEADAADTASPSASNKAASTPALAQATAARTASATQQLRDALGTKLFDGAFTERLADDVMRRVEKRMRIERERRGL